jgi:predicted methyltransferase
MVHLNRPVEAMRAIYKALKPGGVMVCEEADVSAVYSEPPSAAYEEMGHRPKSRSRPGC